MGSMFIGVYPNIIYSYSKSYCIMQYLRARHIFLKWKQLILGGATPAPDCRHRLVGCATLRTQRSLTRLRVFKPLLHYVMEDGSSLGGPCLDRIRVKPSLVQGENGRIDETPRSSQMVLWPSNRCQAHAFVPATGSRRFLSTDERNQRINLEEVSPGSQAAGTRLASTGPTMESQILREAWEIRRKGDSTEVPRLVSDFQQGH
jgi:hypothetical protein